MKIEKQDKNAIFDYEAKYKNASKMQETWPEIPKNVFDNFAAISQKIYDFFDVRGFCRIDFIVRNGEIFFIEINTIPGMTKNSILPKSWEKTGRSFEKLAETIL